MRGGRWAVAVAAIGLVVVAGVSAKSDRRSGTLDRSFSRDGSIVRNFADGRDGIRDLALDRKGRIVAVGNTFGNEIFVARFTQRGRLDKSFGPNGFIATDGGANGAVDPGGIAIDGRNRIVVAAAANVNAGVQSTLLIRLRASGKPDTSFGGGDGFVIADLGPGNNDGAEDVAIVGRQKVLIAGYIDSLEAVVARFRPNGALDGSFGESAPGYTRTDFSSANDYEAQAHAIGRDRRGRIVIAGFVDQGTGRHFAAARFTRGGVLDESFSAGGSEPGFFDTAVDSEVADLALTRRNGIVLLGTETGDPNVIAVVRLNGRGRFVNSFGNNGVRRIAFGGFYDTGESVAVDGRNRVIIGGDHGGGNYQGLQVLRLRANGALDKSWAKRGKFRRLGIDPKPDRGESVNTVELDGEGRILFAGGSFDGSLIGGQGDSFVGRLRR